MMVGCVFRAAWSSQVNLALDIHLFIDGRGCCIYVRRVVLLSHQFLVALLASWNR